MKKVLKRVMIIIAGIIVIFALFCVVMVKKTDKALSNQVNADINMSEVKDGTYTGTSGGGLVKVEVQVTVKDHAITAIELVKHDNGKGKPAEVTLDEMVKKNTDDVDGVSGATASSKTIRNAVNKALQQGIK